MNFLLSLALAFSVSAPYAVARVGENEKELVARYGATTGRQPARKHVQGKSHIYGERLAFRFEDWTVSAVMTGGRCEEINYAKEGKWSDPYFNRLLDINGGRAQWTEQKTLNPNHRRDWLRQDRTTAGWGLTGFMVRTPVMEAILARLNAH